MKCNVILTDSMTTVFFNGKKTNKTFTFFAGEASYEAATKLAKGVIDDIQGGFKVSKEVFETFEQLSDKKAALRAWSRNGLVINETEVTFQGEELSSELTEFLVKLVEEGASDSSFDAWTGFIKALNNSSSNHTVERLFLFLSKNDLYISPCGQYVYAWRVCNSNYKDKYTNSFDNSVGSVCQVPKNQVEVDPNKACSKGLHIASIDYLNSCYASTGDPLLIVKVAIEDIMSIPYDYDGSKVRCSKFEVVAEAGKWNQTVSIKNYPNLSKFGFAAN